MDSLPPVFLPLGYPRAYCWDTPEFARCSPAEAAELQDVLIIAVISFATRVGELDAPIPPLF